MFPNIRLRRNRKSLWIRDLLAENHLKSSDLILPIFIIEGHNKQEEIVTMPGVSRLSIDNVIKKAKEAEKLGIKAIMLFPVIDQKLKTKNGDEAYNSDNLISRCVIDLKKENINIGIIVDVALDPYTTHGHDGILVDDDVENDITVDALCEQALVLARAGVDAVSPSDMMDGRVHRIREALDREGFKQVNIISYPVKYNSSFYGPFRDAVGSKRNNSDNEKDGICKATYQIDSRNSKEAMLEITLDIEEGADVIIIKPGSHFFDIISKASERFDTPILAYQVSGEYAMIKFADQHGAINGEKAMLESLMCFKRAGASAIISYAAIEVAKILNLR